MLSALILFSITPIGFIVLMSLLIFFEYLIIKSVIGDVKTVFNYISLNRESISRFKDIRNFKPNIILAISSLPKVPDVTFKKKKIKEILTTDRIAIDYIKMNEWFS